MGLISLPIMLRYGYDRRLASGVIAASGTLAQIIPPSLVLILMADQLGKSVGDMYKGAFIPGFMLMGLYVLGGNSGHLQAQDGASPPVEARIYREANGNSGYISLAVVMGISTIVAIFLANHMADLHTWWQGKEVTEVATDEKIVTAMCGGTFIAFVLASFNRIFAGPALAPGRARDFRADPAAAADLPGAGHHLPGHCHTHRRRRHGSHGCADHGLCPQTPEHEPAQAGPGLHHRKASFVMFIMIGATTFSLVFQAADGPKWVEHLLTSLPGGQVGFLIVVNIMIFFLAFFLDYFELVHRGASAGSRGREDGH